MADSLFLMQRYWGSDESDVESDARPKTNSLFQLLKKARSIKGKQNKEIDVDDPELIASDIPIMKKKRKKNDDSENSLNESTRAQPSDRFEEIANREIHNDVSATEDHGVCENNISSKSLKRKRQTQVFKTEESEFPLQEEPSEAPISKGEKKLQAEHLDTSEYINGSLADFVGKSEFFPIMKDVHDKKNEVVHRSLPEWLANPTIIDINIKSEEKSVTELDFLEENIKQAMIKNGIKYLFPVQIAVIPWLLQTSLKRLLVRPSDLCVSAPTGSGKTLAFVVPIVQSLKERTVQRIRALVVLPVNDLAVQVFKVFESFCKGMDLRVVLVTGQKSFSQEQTALVKKCTKGFMSLADIVVSTPGRLIDHIDHTPGFSLQQLRFLVIDEADRMMEEIQQGWLKKVEDSICKDRSTCTCSLLSMDDLYQKSSLTVSTACAYGHISEPVQKLFYSATLSQDPEKLHELALYRPKLFTSAANSNKLSGATSLHDDNFIGKYTTPESLTEQYITCDARLKPLMICHLIQEKGFKKILCFTHSLEHSHRLNLVLNEMLKDLSIRELSSNLTGVQRKIVLQQFAGGKISVLVCSDLLARGMDIEDVDCVISYDAPHFMKTYIHRIGRTARAGKSGVAVTLLEKFELPNFKRMLATGGKVLPQKVEVPYENFVPLEETFKKALSVASSTIDTEKRGTALLKKGVKRNKRQFTRTNNKHSIRNNFNS